MEVQMMAVTVLFTVAFLGVVRMVVRACDALILKPKRLRSILRKQGIRGPPPSFLLGNITDMQKIQNSTQPSGQSTPQGSEQGMTHSCASLVFPHFHQWSQEYGSTFMFSVLNMQFLYMNNLKVLKEFSTYTSSNIGKSPLIMEMFDPLAGQGIANSNGEVWARQRKIIAPEFFMDKVKGMTKLMAESVESTVVKPLISLIDGEGGVADVNVDEHMTNFARHVISRLCFGSNHSEGEDIFLKLDALEEITSKQGPINSALPLLRYIPTKSNREIKRLKKEIRGLILKIVKERKKAMTTQKDLLQMIFEAAANSGLSQNAMDTFIVDNCKSIYLGGYETTASSAMWTLMLLAINPQWQAKARAEVLEICGGQKPEANMLRNMKILTMVIQESLRLYPPAPVISREALEDVKFGGIDVPKGVNIWISAVALHYDEEIWGSDAKTFNPERFANGVNGSCKSPHVYVPFGSGPRICLGQHFSMIELKILLAVMLSYFSFSLSPKYNHSPRLKVVMEPKDGVNLIIRKL